MIKNEIEQGNAARQYQQADHRIEKDQKILADVAEILGNMEAVTNKVAPWKAQNLEKLRALRSAWEEEK